MLFPQHAFSLNFDRTHACTKVHFCFFRTLKSAKFACTSREVVDILHPYFEGQCKGNQNRQIGTFDRLFSRRNQFFTKSQDYLLQFKVKVFLHTG